LVWPGATNAPLINVPPTTDLPSSYAGASHGDVTGWADRSIGVQCWDALGHLTTAPFNVFFTGAV
jgi:hypothetical protein